MTAPFWLIAEREIRTYVATASFWIALAIGPLIAGGALFVSNHQAPPPAISIRTNDPKLLPATQTALADVGRFEDQHFVFADEGATVALARTARNLVTVRFAKNFPLSREGRALAVRTLERDLDNPDANAAPKIVDEFATPALPIKFDPAQFSGFALMMMLWLTLTGSLGMLLQSVVRERANRALECLLAAASPEDIMLGKLVGVGAISFGILGAWLGSIVVFSGFAQANDGFVPLVLSTLAAPRMLLYATLIYALGYGFYGSITIALGAIARDTAAAQNLSRPMFVVLLAAFFLALFSASSGTAPLNHTLVLLPPFSPFLLLLHSADGLPVLTQAMSLVLLLASALLAARIAVNYLSIAPQPFRLSGLLPPKLKLL